MHAMMIIQNLELRRRQKKLLGTWFVQVDGAHLAINHSQATVPVVLLHGIISLVNSDKDNRNITVKVSKFSHDEFKVDLDFKAGVTSKIVRTLFSIHVSIRRRVQTSNYHIISILWKLVGYIVTRIFYLFSGHSLL